MLSPEFRELIKQPHNRSSTLPFLQLEGRKSHLELQSKKFHHNRHAHWARLPQSSLQESSYLQLVLAYRPPNRTVTWLRRMAGRLPHRRGRILVQPSVLVDTGVATRNCNPHDSISEKGRQMLDLHQHARIRCHHHQSHRFNRLLGSTSSGSTPDSSNGSVVDRQHNSRSMDKTNHRPQKVPKEKHLPESSPISPCSPTLAFVRTNSAFNGGVKRYSGLVNLSSIHSPLIFSLCCHHCTAVFVST